MFFKSVNFYLGNNPPLFCNNPALFPNKAWLFSDKDGLFRNNGWVLQRKVCLSADEEDDVLDVGGVGKHVDGLDGGDAVVGVEIV